MLIFINAQSNNSRILKNLHINLIIALLTFGMGVLLASTWLSYNSVDKRFEKALPLVYSTREQEACSRFAMSAEKCAALKNQDEYRIAVDSANTEKGCRDDRLSAAGCERRKEAVIKELETMVLDKTKPE